MSLSLLLSPNPLSVVNLHISISQAQAQQLGLVRKAARALGQRWEVPYVNYSRFCRLSRQIWRRISHSKIKNSNNKQP